MLLRICTRYSFNSNSIRRSNYLPSAVVFSRAPHHDYFFSTTSSNDQKFDDSTPTNNNDSRASLTTNLLALSKARLSLLVVTTTSLGFLSAGPIVSTEGIPALASVVVGTALCSASAATLNQIAEIDRDSLMKRTRNRPLINHGGKQSISKEGALAWGCVSGVSGMMVLGLGTDTMTTMLGVGNIVLYSGIYTYMKPRSEWNTWVGAVVGAVPPV